jgi:hypothetical protein
MLAAAAVLAPLVGACDPGQGPDTGLTQPVITSGQFIPGDLPGTPPPDGGTPSDDDAGDAAASLKVRVVTFMTSEVPPGGAVGQGLSGFVSSDSAAVGMRIDGLGSGYWVVPVGAVDLSDPTEVSFGMTASFEPTIPAGVHDLLFVAIGSSGQGGVQYPQPFCFSNIIPDNGHACNPKLQPPGAVFTLQWDTNFDLDLHVVTPSGEDINPKQPYGALIDAGPQGPDKTLPHIDRDSLRGCVVDGLRQEDVIFPVGLPIGTYTIYVDPYAACGQTAARFTFTVHESSGTCPSCTFGPIGTPVSGEVLASQVTGGLLPPLKIDQIVVR